MQLSNLNNDNDAKDIRLEGIPPDRFEGDRSKTVGFLIQFKRFMLMNQQASIARDPICKASYFLSLMGGPKVDTWILRQYKWLDDIDDDPTLLPYNMNA